VRWGVVGVSAPDSRLGEPVRLLADLLAVLFERDRQLAMDMNAAQRRLLAANDQVRTRALAGSSASDLAVTIRAAFVDYQRAAEVRRGLGADVGEAVVRLVDAMTAAGFSEDQARRADVWALRDGVYREG
jgi:hypothetical protein